MEFTKPIATFQSMIHKPSFSQYFMTKNLGPWFVNTASRGSLQVWGYLNQAQPNS
jgi:hypothetical protein